jgi:hypothetical protein
MKTIAQIISEAIRTSGCTVLPAIDLPATPLNLQLPSDLRDFYELCGGLDMFPGTEQEWRFVNPNEVVRADPFILDKAYTDRPEVYDGKPSETLYLIAVAGVGPEFITIDFEPKRNGLCFDSYSGDHGTESSKVIALSFTELLNKLFYWKQPGLFWENEFYGYLGQPIEQLNLQSLKSPVVRLP